MTLRYTELAPDRFRDFGSDRFVAAAQHYVTWSGSMNQYENAT